MLDDDTTDTTGATTADQPAPDQPAPEPTDAGAAAPDAPPPDSGAAESAPGEDAAADQASPAVAGDEPPAKKTARKTTRKASTRPRKTAAAPEAATEGDSGAGDAPAAAADDTAGAPGAAADEPASPAPAKKTAKRAAAKRTTTRKTSARKTAAAPTDDLVEPAPGEGPGSTPAEADGTETPAASPAPSEVGGPVEPAPGEQPGQTPAPPVDGGPEEPDDLAAETDEADGGAAPAATSPIVAPAVLFKAPDPVTPQRRRVRRSAAVVVPGPERDEPAAAADQPADETAADPDLVPVAPVDDVTGTPADDVLDDDAAGPDEETAEAGTPDDDDDTDDAASSDEQGTRRRRRRGGRRRRRGAGEGDDGADTGESATGSAEDQPADDAATAGRGSGDKPEGGRGSGRGQRDGRGGSQGSGQAEAQGSGPAEDAADADEGTGSRRRRRRRRTGEDDGGGDESGTVVRVRKPRNAEDEITSLHGSTRLEAKKQRRREGREAGRRRAPIVSEAEFLARREAVERVMVIRQKQELTQIAVLEDKVLVEHYVARESQTSLIGNVYLGRVQNVLPSMEAAFIDIGKGRNAVLYAGEVNWDALGAGNGPRKIEQVLKSGQPILVQVSKDPIGHKGARLTSQVSLPGRFLVYVPDGTTSGISRKLPDTERSRLKTLLKEIVPDSAGVIVRTAAEGASEEELTLDVERLTTRWAEIEAKIAAAPKTGGGPQLLYGEPDLTLKVVRDLFTEDFATLVISGDEAWDTVDGYVKQVAPDLEDRLERYDGEQDVFAAYRVDEQIAKGLDRKVWLPSGGSLVIDRTEAMTVVDVNTGKFTGSGGNLEETVTKNNLEAAEEIVRQLRLRDIGGIIVVDFIDMVLESNRDLVLRRLVECLGRDRTRHQVAEVTSLGLVQMTRKRIGTGLLESFSENCDHCQGRGVVIHHEPVEPRKQQDDEPRRGGRRGRGRGDSDTAAPAPTPKGVPSPKDIAAMARHDPKPPLDLPSDVAAGGLVDAGATAGLSGEPALDATSDATSDAASDAAVDGPLEVAVVASGDAPADVPGGAAGAVAADEATDGASTDAQTDAPTDAPADGSTEGAVASGDAPTSVPALGNDPWSAYESDAASAEPAPAAAASVDAVALPSLAGPQVTAPPTEDDPTDRDGIDQTGRAPEDVPVVPAADDAEVAPTIPLLTGGVDSDADGPAADGTEQGVSGDQTAASVPTGPRLVTSSRRRVARRPAGPPAAVPHAGAEVGSARDGIPGTGTLVDDPQGLPADDGLDGSAVDTDAVDAPHVPVKKRGRRR